MSLSKIFIFILLSMTFIACTNYINPDQYSYSNNLIWSDEFPGNSIDSDKWNFETGNTGWGNNEWQNYTSSTENAYIDNGYLILQAVYNNNGYKNGNFTSARLSTKSHFEFTYGKVEARILLPEGKGIWPAFWMLGTSFPDEKWPDCGEIDIMENLGDNPDKIYGTIHGPGYSGTSSLGSSTSIEENVFHVYSVLWEPNQITWYVDNQEYYKAESKKLLFWQKWRHDQPYFLIMNMAVGGNWPGYPNETTLFPQKMVIDWVRVYQ